MPNRLPTGRSAVLLTGSLRQATPLAVGGALCMVTGIDIGQPTRTAVVIERAVRQIPDTRVTELYAGQGRELGVALAVATDPTEDILEFICKRELPIERLLVLHPPTGTKDNAVVDAATALALAAGVRDTVRQACRNNPRAHLSWPAPWASRCYSDIGRTG